MANIVFCCPVLNCPYFRKGATLAFNKIVLPLFSPENKFWGGKILCILENTQVLIHLFSVSLLQILWGYTNGQGRVPDPLGLQLWGADNTSVCLTVMQGRIIMWPEKWFREGALSIPRGQLGRTSWRRCHWAHIRVWVGFPQRKGIIQSFKISMIFKICRKERILYAQMEIRKLPDDTSLCSMPARAALGEKPLLAAQQLQQLARIFHMRVHRKSEFSCIFFTSKLN